MLQRERITSILHPVYFIHVLSGLYELIKVWQGILRPFLQELALEKTSNLLRFMGHFARFYGRISLPDPFLRVDLN
jgi:hypothetical protein